MLPHTGCVSRTMSSFLSFLETALPSTNASLYSLAGDHVTHLENVSEEEMNRLLGIVLDVEYLYTCVHKEEDADTKQVYFSLFKVSPASPPPTPPSYHADLYMFTSCADAPTCLSSIRSC